MTKINENVSLSPREKMAVARYAAREAMPYMRAALYALVPREVPGMGTLATNERGIMSWDPEAVKMWTIAELAWVQIHECQHLVRGHFERARSIAADPMLWNLAADCEINDDPYADLLPPVGALMPEMFQLENGRTAEEYYRHIQEQSKKKGWKNQGEGNGQGDEKGEGEKGSSSSKGKGKTKPEPGKGWCGGCANRPVDGEPDSEESKADGLSDGRLERIKRQVAEDIKREVAQRGRGCVPESWQRWAEEFTKPAKIRWQDKLRQVARNAVAFRPGAVDYTMRRLARRQFALDRLAERSGFLSPRMPALWRPIPRIAIAVDTSGSMGTVELSAALREANGVLRSIGEQVDFLACDAEVNAVRKVRNINEALAALKGGGGTDFNPVFDQIRKMGNKGPEVLIFATDGDGNCPVQPPAGLRVIWLLVGSHRREPCAWGEKIHVED